MIEKRSVNYSQKTRLDDLSYWNVKKPFNSNEIVGIDEEEQSTVLSVSLLMKHKNISSSKLIKLPSHIIASPKCQCRRLFHIFCTDLFHENDHNIEMINIQPGPHCYDRDSSRRVSTPYKKYRQGLQENNKRDIIKTISSELSPVIIPKNQTLEKKSRILPKIPSLNIPTSHFSLRHSLQIPAKCIPSKQFTSTPSLQVHAIPIFDQSSLESHVFLPRTPPSSPTQDSSMVSLRSTTPAPLQVVSLVPHVRNFNDNDRKLSNISSMKITTYEDSVREYLSTSDSSDDDRDINKTLTVEKPNLSPGTQSLSRPGTAFSVRLLLHNAKRRASVAKVHYSLSDVQRYVAEKSRRVVRSQTRLMGPISENYDVKANTKIESVPQTKSVFGFAKTASSMHFGFAADRLGLQGTFEKWPRPLSRRTPIERKQEVTTLRLVTLPLVTS